jgi:hypothetical protein
MNRTLQLLTNGDLIVRGVPEKDAVSTGGTIYKCTAKNILGEISTEVVLVRSVVGNLLYVAFKVPKHET